MKSIYIPPKKNCRRFKAKSTKRSTNLKRLSKGRHTRRTLKGESTPHQIQKPTIPKELDVSKYYHNLTGINITDEEKFIFYLCQKFCPTPLKVDWSKFEQDINEWAYLLRWSYKFGITHNKQQKPSNHLDRTLVKKEHRTPIATSNCPALELYIELVKNDLLSDNNRSKKVYDNLHPDHRKALENMKHWDKDKNLIIRPYDKGDGLFIDTKDNYKSRVLAELQTPTYKYIEDHGHMSNMVVNKIESWVEKWKHLDVLSDKLLKWTVPNNTNAPGKAYMNYKKHKEGHPGRLITSGCGSYTENLSEFTAHFLKERQKLLPHVAIDINQVLRKIDEINYSGSLKNKNIIHASFDVISMFPNIDKEMGIPMCRAELEKRENKAVPTECIIEALELTLDYNICQFNGNWYQQTTGTAMGPHNSCEYADLSMSYIDNIVNSDINPYKHCIHYWVRYRDDIYTPWLGTVEELQMFHKWLNTLSPTIKFTVEYGTSIAFLDITIYDENGTIKTKIYSKASDTHAYLLPNSCHPVHICESIPNTVARRVKKLNADNETYEASKDTYTSYLKDRGYSDSTISNAFLKFDNVERSTLYMNISSENSKRTFPLITEFNPKHPKVSSVLHKHKYVLELDQKLLDIIPPSAIFASYRQPPNIKSFLTRSSFRDGEYKCATDLIVNTESGRCISCSNCILCKLYLIDTCRFKSYESNQTFSINNQITCTTKGVIYLIKDICCKRSYTGSTITDMRTRWANYKNHIKTGYKACELANHVVQSTLSHPINRDEKIDFSLQHQFKVILIDRVDLGNNRSTRDKRNIIVKCEGEWIDKLKTLEKYGGFNRRDETKIANSQAG